MKYLIVVMLVFLGGALSAQTSFLSDVNYGHLEKLISLALENYPRTNILKIQEREANNSIGMARMSYLDVVNVSYFYRPEDRATLNPENPFVFNGFQLGLTISPGIFFQKPYEVKSAKMAHEVSKLQIVDAERTLITRVKSVYYDYIAARNDVRLKGELYQELNTLFEEVKFKYEKGEATLEAYSSARTSSLQANGDLSESEVAYLRAKDELEELIGVSLDDVKF